MSPRGFIARKAKVMSGFKVSMGRYIPLVTDFAVGNLKLKPMFNYHTEKFKALTDYTKSTLPVFYKWSNKD